MKAFELKGRFYLFSFGRTQPRTKPFSLHLAIAAKCFASAVAVSKQQVDYSV